MTSSIDSEGYTAIDISPSLMTEQAIVRHMKALGYDPRVNQPRTPYELLEDLYQNEGFRQWAHACIDDSAGPRDRHTGYYGCLEGRPHGERLVDDINLIMGECTPVWAKRIHVLLSWALSNQW